MQASTYILKPVLDMHLPVQMSSFYNIGITNHMLVRDESKVVASYFTRAKFFLKNQ